MSTHSFRRALSPCLLAILAAAFVRPRLEAADDLTLVFGVYTSDKPTDMYRMFKPTLIALEENVARKLSRPVQIRLKVFNTYDAARKALVEEEVDFVRFGPASYVLAKKENPGLHLLVIEEQEGQYTFKGVIFTREESGIKSVGDLRGKSFAFGDPDSTIGRYLAQAFFVNAGVYSKDLSRFEHLDRHDRVVEAVVSGKFDAGVAKESSFEKMKHKGLKVLETFDNITKPWVARSRLDPVIVSALRDGLASVKDQKVLDAMGEKTTGFNAKEATDDKYDAVRVGMKKSDEFAKGPKSASAEGPQPGN